MFEFTMEKKSFEAFSKFEESRCSLLPLLQNYSMFKYFAQSPIRKLIHLVQSIDLQLDVSIQTRIQLIYFLAMNYFFIRNNFRVYSDSIFDKFIEKFNPTWKNLQNWKQALLQLDSTLQIPGFHQSYSIFIELLATLFGIDIFGLVKHKKFHSMRHMNQTKDDIHRLLFYLQHRFIKNDMGYPHHLTLIEIALQHKKFTVVQSLLQKKEGQKIHVEYFYHLIQKGNQQKLSNELANNEFYSEKLQSEELNIIPQIFSLIEEVHPEVLRPLVWEHIWSQEFSSQSLHHQSAFIITRGNLEFNQNHLDQIFDNFKEFKLKPLEDNVNYHYLLDFQEYCKAYNAQEVQWTTLKVDNYLIQSKYLLFQLDPTGPSLKYMANSFYKLFQATNQRLQVELCFAFGHCFYIEEVLPQSITLESVGYVGL